MSTSAPFFYFCVWLGVRLIALGVFARNYRIYTWDNARTYVYALLYEGQNHFDRQLKATKSEPKTASDLPA